ncbi:MAG: tRNA-binding protein [Candidatus Geothermarchaeales archaeon]
MGSISMRDFQSLDLRIGKVVDAERIAGMRKILKLRVDIGGEIRESIAGGAEYYGPEYFIGKSLVFLVNLEPKTIAGVESSVMPLAADYGGKPVWLTPEEEVPAGVKVR